MSPGPPWVEGKCPRCGARWRGTAAAEGSSCRQCGLGLALHRESLDPDGTLRGCLACGHGQMYRARDFPRRLGIGVVVVAAALAPWTYYISLGAAALLDAVLLLVVPLRVHCYRCGAVHRRFQEPEAWPAFHRAVADWHRFGERAAVIQTLGAGQAPPAARRRGG